MSKVREVGQALLDFRAGGKKVVGYSAGILTQRPYYVLAHSDEVSLHPDGTLLLLGLGSYRPYYKDGLDRYGVQMHVFRVGEYKSAVEPFLRNDMSPEAREATGEVLGDLWRTWLAGVAEARGLDAEELQGWIEDWIGPLYEAGGDVAKAALDRGLVDTLAHPDEVRKRMIELVGEDDEGKTFKQVPYSTYLAARAKDRNPWDREEGVAVVVAVGDVLDGSQPSGRIGGDSTARLVRRARQDEKAKAVVLRIDSGGGSAFASEVIRRECELVREAGKPLVVSMSSVAASGAYAISSPADEIWASPSTITGSIGIFAVFPSVHEALDRYLGIHVDGVGTTPHAGALEPRRPLEADAAEAIRLIIEDGYEDFVTRVAEGRGQTWDEVDRIARGRVWSGEDAVGLGLVDRIGNLQDAIESAAERAKLEEGYRVFYVERERSLRDRLLERFLAWSAQWAPTPSHESAPLVVRTLRSVEAELERFALWNDPKGLYAHCLCGEW
jgi:protease-4